jgi:hypothetical protein
MCRRSTHPDLFLVQTAHNGQPQIDATAAVATRERGILGLRIHAHGRSAHAEARCDARIGVQRRVRFFDRLEEGEFV